MRTVRRPVADPTEEEQDERWGRDTAGGRRERNRELSKLRMRRYRERLRTEARIQEQMRRWGVDRERAIKQLTQRPRTAAEVEADRRLREQGMYDRDPRFPGRGFPDHRRTLRPRDRWRAPGTTPEARARRLRRAEYRRRERDPFTAPEDESGYSY